MKPYVDRRRLVGDDVKSSTLVGEAVPVVAAPFMAPEVDLIGVDERYLLCFFSLSSFIYNITAPKQ